MAQIDRYRSTDRDDVEALYRRIFGRDAGETNRLRWDWQYQDNPSRSPDGPDIWIARDGAVLVGQYASMPVRLWVRSHVLRASWGMDVMVAPERQRQGLGERLFLVWDRHVDASLGLGLSESSHRLFKKLHWPDVGPVPYLVSPLRANVLGHDRWPRSVRRLVAGLTMWVARRRRRTWPMDVQIESVATFGSEHSRLWERVAPAFDLAVVRDADYLNWRFVRCPHPSYSRVAVRREGQLVGYAVFRHARDVSTRTTVLVDYLFDPHDAPAFGGLLQWLAGEARAAGSDKIRTCAIHAGFRKTLRRTGYFEGTSTIDCVVKINALDVPADFYDATWRWHITPGDSDQDR